MAVGYNHGGLILNAMSSVRDRLNDSLSNAYPRTESWVILSNLVDHKGQEENQTSKRLVMCLVNLSQETVISTYKSALSNSKSGYSIVSPPIYINLEILFYANLEGKEYEQGLTVISSVISFFQQIPVFNSENAPGLDPKIDKLAFEFTSLDMTTLSYVMGLVGTKYLPCVLYKVRMLPFQAEAVRGDISAVRGTSYEG